MKLCCIGTILFWKNWQEKLCKLNSVELRRIQTLRAKCIVMLAEALRKVLHRSIFFSSFALSPLTKVLATASVLCFNWTMYFLYSTKARQVLRRMTDL